MYSVPQNHPLPSGCKGAAIAIGNFDGMHLGHQALVRHAEKQAEMNNCVLGMVTFEPHPRSLFRPDEPMFRLSTTDMKARLAKALGVQFLESVTFDKALAGLEPQEFVNKILVDRLAVSHVVTGYDFHFGKGRKGSPETMRELGKKYGFGVTIVDQVTDNDGVAPYSSSYIRTALRRGHVSHAAHQLGYWWSVMGTVVKGDQRGRTIGFPTVNIELDIGCEPHEGIYAVRVRHADKSKNLKWDGAGYIGYRPTFETEKLFLEVFLFDFDGDLYGEQLIVEFIDFIRPDKKFDELDDLLTQMNADCKQARQTLHALNKENPMLQYPLGRLQANNEL